jgi:hypothetical protein
MGVEMSRIEKWTGWKSFPNPKHGGYITAPFGPGCYELRRCSGEPVLFGTAGHVAYRMCSLLPDGKGTRNNTAKRDYVGKHLDDIEYRVIAFRTKEEAGQFERQNLWARRTQYVFPT